MKYEKCPKCDSKRIGDEWQNGRKLQQSCVDCHWRGNLRIPEQQEIKTTKNCLTGQFNGFHYELYDCYGHIIAFSKYYNKEDEARKDIEHDIVKGKTDGKAGPYTAVFWQPTVKAQGEVVK